MMAKWDVDQQTHTNSGGAADIDLEIGAYSFSGYFYSVIHLASIWHNHGSDRTIDVHINDGSVYTQLLSFTLATGTWTQLINSNTYFPNAIILPKGWKLRVKFNAVADTKQATVNPLVEHVFYGEDK